MIHTLHLITGLERGGAETMLARLVAGMDRSRFRNTVVALTDRGPLAEEMESCGAQTYCLGMHRSMPDPRGLLRLVRLLRAIQPDLLQSWLYHADLLGIIAATMLGGPPVLWNLRCSNMELAHYAVSTRITVRALALLSRRPIAVLVNSEAGRRHHVALGYRPRRWALVPNGIDTDRFRPDPVARARQRTALQVADNDVLIGHVARVDPMKDHGAFIAAAAAVAAARPATRIALLGKGTEQLFALANKGALAGRVHCLGERDDVAAIMTAFDLFCLSSAFGEGFPSVLGEAMACGLPTVTTDVGDAATIVGQSGLVVPPRSPSALADALIALIDRGPDGWAEIGPAARARILADYTPAAAVERYESVYLDLVGEQTADAIDPERRWV